MEFSTLFKQSKDAGVISIERRVLSHVMTVPYVSPFFSESLYPRGVKNRLHSSPKPPFVPKINGVKEPCSTSKTRSKYSRFFSCSCLRNICFVVWFLEDLEFTCVTLTSKNAVSPFLQKPFALMYNLASSLLLADLRVNHRVSHPNNFLKNPAPFQNIVDLAYD